MVKKKHWTALTGLLAAGVTVAVLTGCGSGSSASATPSMAGGVPAQPVMPTKAAGAQVHPGQAGIAPGAPGTPMGGMPAGGAIAPGGQAPGAMAPGAIPGR